MVVTRQTRSRDVRQAFFTDSSLITSFMASRLQAGDADVVWEPCAGQGHLIDAVRAKSPSAMIWATEIDCSDVEYLADRYRNDPRVVVRHGDALDVDRNTLFSEYPPFTRVIANPPYGAYQSEERRLQLKKRFPGAYVKETYGMILLHSIQQLQPKGKLVFIIPDTFLWLHRHESLRRSLLADCTIEEIVLFPSRFFPGVQFGYSGMCIITVSKMQPHEDHVISVLNDLPDEREFFVLADANRHTSAKVSHLRQREVLLREHADFQFNRDSYSVDLKGQNFVSLGDIAEVKTGFYSGNDVHWVRRDSSNVPRSKKFQDVDRQCIYCEARPSLNGLTGQQTFVPILRGGAARFKRRTDWYIDWSADAVSEYRRSGKNPARFQNSQFYFREGIGVPMVSSGRLTAALLEGRLFDQGLVGIFPHDEDHIHFLLGFLNTELAWRLIRNINPTANNSANYIKRIPVVLPGTDEISRTGDLVRKAIHEVGNGGEPTAATMASIEDVYRSIWCEADQTL